MMSRIRVPWPAWLCLAALTVACSCSGLSLVPSSSGSSAPQNFPLTPNPLNVQITLDSAHAISSGTGELSGNLADGGDFNFIESDGMMTQAADGSYELVPGTKMTLTPVSAIGGLPFSQGFLHAFQFGPEGLLMITPGMFEMHFPGSYSDLVGFAANGDGTDFHLYPIDASVSGGDTWVTFNISHFSMYGVAEATASEITAQQAHPPSSPGDQDDELLAAPGSVTQQKLSQEHDRLLKSLLTNLNACNNVVTAARNFMKWYGNVQAAGEQKHFADTISTDTNTLLPRLKDCLQISCPLCMQGKKPDKKTAKDLIVQATYVVLFDTMQSNAPDANYYRELANKCAANAGLPLPSPHVADCQGSSCGPTPTALSCP
jgi:uncharacterized protein involved in tolerance to divalent cations